MKEYSLKFTQVSKHAPSMVANSRTYMNKFFMGVFDIVVNECRSVMLIQSMDISHLMSHDEQIEEQKIKLVGMALKRSRTDEEISPRLGVKYKTNQGSKRDSNQVPTFIQSQIKGGGQLLSLKEAIRVVLYLKVLVVISVVQSMKVSVVSIWEFAMDVSKVATN